MALATSRAAPRASRFHAQTAYPWAAWTFVNWTRKSLPTWWTQQMCELLYCFEICVYIYMYIYIWLYTLELITPVYCCPACWQSRWMCAAHWTTIVSSCSLQKSSRISPQSPHCEYLLNMFWKCLLMSWAYFADLTPSCLDACAGTWATTWSSFQPTQATARPWRQCLHRTIPTMSLQLHLQRQRLRHITTMGKCSCVLHNEYTSNYIYGWLCTDIYIKAYAASTLILLVFSGLLHQHRQYQQDSLGSQAHLRALSRL